MGAIVRTEAAGSTTTAESLKAMADAGPEWPQEQQKTAEPHQQQQPQPAEPIELHISRGRSGPQPKHLMFSEDANTV